MIGTRGHFGYVLDRLPTLPNVALVAASPGGDSLDAIDAWASVQDRSFERFHDWLGMLDRARPDACVVCGPFETHAAMCVACIDRGIHVLTEKPAAMTDDELASLTAAVARNPDVHLAGMMASRYDVGFYNAWRLINDGAVGRVRLMNVRKSYKLGTRAAFYHDRATYGGTIPWVGSHAIDWALWFAGDRAPRSVYATHSARDNVGNGTMERSAACLFQFDDEVSATVSIDVLRPAAAPTHGDDWARIVGTDGVIEAWPDRAVLLDADGESTYDRPCPRDHVGDFVERILTGRPAWIDAASTLALTRACLAARRSADTGEVVRL